MIEAKHIFLHEIKLPEDGKNSEFAEKFNGISDLFQHAMRCDIPEDEARRYWDMFVTEKFRLEMGY